MLTFFDSFYPLVFPWEFPGCQIQCLAAEDVSPSWGPMNKETIMEVTSRYK